MLKRFLAIFLLTVCCFAQWGGNPTLIVEEEDGSPSVAGVWKIKVNNSSLTDNGSGVVTLDVTISAVQDSVTWNNETDAVTWNNETDIITWGG